ncbi:hypothetical protein MNV49_000420 [Pseudohyphozyma bogoriensis]|nr:hypothetical protein MNV49_000420 [Pseudohyphozyma bogoriensis]
MSPGVVVEQDGLAPESKERYPPPPIDEERPLKYPAYRPVVAHEFVPPPLRFEHHDPGLRADPALPAFYASPDAILTDITPKLGTKITGVQLAELDAAGLDELALLIARRGFVVFGSRPGFAQTYRDVGIPKQLEIARHFGVLLKQAGGLIPEGAPEISVVYQDKVNKTRAAYWANRNSMIHWHRDQSQEPQPPGYTFFTCLESTGTTGGDTLFSNCVEAYERLSPPVQDFLVTGKRVLNIDTPEVLTHIEGVTREESKWIHEFLLHHISFGQDFQARVSWEEGDVAIWDQVRAFSPADVPIGGLGS